MRGILTLFLILIASSCFAQPLDTVKIFSCGKYCGLRKTNDTTSLSKAVVGKITCIVIQPVKKDTAKTIFRFHCLRTLTEADRPLMVIDGVPQIIPPFSKLDPHTIDSITILKGAIATTIYGSQGANGVILITPKKIKKIDPLIIKKETPKIPGLKVYPNPVQEGNMLNLQFNNDDGKEKTIRIVNLDGKILFQQVLKSNERKNLFQLPTDPRWSAGIYFVQLLYENGQVAASEKIIIQ